MKTLAELQEHRNSLAAEIREFANKCDPEKGWPDQSTKQKWEGLNKQYDDVMAEMDGARTASRVDLVNHLQNSPVPDSRGIGREDTPGGRLLAQRQQRQGMKFRDSQGKIIQAFAAGEPLMPEYLARQANREVADVDVGDVIHSMITGRPENIGRDAFNAAIGGVDADGGFTLEPTLSTRLIDLARDASVVMRAGGQTLPMDNGTMSLASITGDPSPQWRAEGVDTTASSMTFGRVTLRAKTLAAVVPVSLELLEDAQNIAQIVRNALVAAMGVELDRAALIGDAEGEEPTGIRNTAGIGTISSVGTPDDYSHITQAVGQVMQAKYNGDPSGLSMVAHPRDWQTYDGLVDTTGQPLMPTKWADAVQKLSTTAMPTDEGGGSDESVAFLGDFSQVVVGMRTGIRIRIATDGTATDTGGNTFNAGSGLMRHVIAYMRADVALLRPSFMTVLEGITSA